MKYVALVRGSKKVLLHRDVGHGESISRQAKGECSGGTLTPMSCAVEWFTRQCDDGEGGDTNRQRKRQRSNGWSIRESVRTKAAAWLECVLVPGEVLFVPHGWHYSELLLDECVSVEGLLELSSSAEDGALAQHHTDSAALTAETPATGSGSGLQWGNLMSSEAGGGSGFRFC
jgi:hypothetical protein